MPIFVGRRPTKRAAIIPLCAVRRWLPHHALSLWTTRYNGYRRCPPRISSAAGETGSRCVAIGTSRDYSGAAPATVGRTGPGQAWRGLEDRSNATVHNEREGSE